MNRNILENYIDTALTIKRELSRPLSDLAGEFKPDGGLPDWNTNKDSALKALESDLALVVAKIFALSPDRLTDQVSGMTTLVACSGNILLLNQVCLEVMQKALDFDDSGLLASVLDKIFSVSFRHTVLSDQVFEAMAKADPAVFLNKALFGLFSCKELLEQGKTSQLATRFVALAQDHGLTEE